MTASARRTPLYPLHANLGARMVDFAGWSMPVQYPAGIIAEHTQCREKAALFDVSHMGQVILRGPDIAGRLERLVPSDIQALKSGQARYTLFTDETGGILDDLIVTNGGDHLYAVVNASMREQDLAHMREHLGVDNLTEVTDRALLAIQGPAAETVLATLNSAVRDLTFLQSARIPLLGADALVSRLGYTGEDGFEISIPEDRAMDIAQAILEHDDCAPAGLGARDSLRLEAGLSLYGNDIDRTTSPVEAGLGWTVQKRRRSQGGFPGADRILKELDDGPARKLVGLRPEGRAPARQGVEIETPQGEPIGRITSGGFGPTVGGPVAMGYVRTDHAAPGTAVQLMIRGKAQPAQTVALPFVAHHYKR
ncbi:MAG: glycine cleavage system aminomethyltransferase GcvT [Marinibacterium sp.]